MAKEQRVAFRVLAGLAVICALAGITLFFLHAFSYVIALALAVVFALGATVARFLRPLGRAH
jgi:membrane protein YdbS with pleckstrin-like domain